MVISVRTEVVKMAFNFVCVYVLAAQLCLTLCNIVDCSPPDSSVHEILQARILELVAVSYSRGSSHPRDRNWVSCIAGKLYHLGHLICIS